MTFLGSHTGVTATFTPGVATGALGDVMAGFSSWWSWANIRHQQAGCHSTWCADFGWCQPHARGCCRRSSGANSSSDCRNIDVSPHVAGAGAIVKAMHPDRTPGQIKSALMTTAKVNGVVKEDEVTPATPYEYGGGRIDLSVAGNPGVTFDESAANYLALKDPNFGMPTIQVSITRACLAR